MRHPAYTDNANTSFSHTATYCFDGVNRLTQAVATGNSAYNLAFSYDQYGNMSCNSGSCASMSFNASTNQATAIGMQTPQYDAAGDMTNDTQHTYQYDAEGRVVSVDNGATWQQFVYNALGDRAEWVNPGGGADQHLFDPSGTGLGNAGQYSVVRGTGDPILYISGETAYLHRNNLGSSQTQTDYSGAEIQDMMFYPWGQVWWQAQSGIGWGFADMPYWDTGTNTSFTKFREYQMNLGRWMTPDPGGMKVVKLENPQSWNMYAYVNNNPTTLTDPTGLKACSSSNVKSHQYDCHKAKSQTFTYSVLGGVVAQRQTSATTTDADGQAVTTQTVTTAEYSTEKGREGEFLGASQTVTGPDGRTRVAIGQAGAERTIGSETVNSAIAQASSANAPGFFTTTGRDIAAHPLGYGFTALELIGIVASEGYGLPAVARGAGAAEDSAIHGPEVIQDAIKLIHAYGY